MCLSLRGNRETFGNFSSTMGERACYIFNLWLSDRHHHCPTNFLFQYLSFFLNQHHQICFIRCFFWSQNMHSNRQRKTCMFRKSFAQAKLKKNVLQNFHRNINKGMVRENEQNLISLKHKGEAYRAIKEKGRKNLFSFISRFSFRLLLFSVSCSFHWILIFNFWRQLKK